MKLLTLGFGVGLTVSAIACSQQPGQTAGATVPSVPSARGSESLRSHGTITYIPLTTTFSATDANGLPANIAGDGLGSYSDGVAGVLSHLVSNGYNGIQYGDWQFDTYSSTARKVSYMFNPADAVQPGDPHYDAPANPPYWGTQTAASHNEVKCTLVHNDMLTMGAGSTFTCPLVEHFTLASGVEYGFGAAVSFTGDTGTTDIQVTCNKADANGCNDWSLDPINLGQAVARLTDESTKRTTNDGNFYIRFHFHLTRP